MIAPSNIGDNHWPHGGIDTARDHRLFGVVISRFERAIVRLENRFFRKILGATKATDGENPASKIRVANSCADLCPTKRRKPGWGLCAITPRSQSCSADWRLAAISFSRPCYKGLLLLIEIDFGLV
jgi:hypothetical protein